MAARLQRVGGGACGAAAASGPGLCRRRCCSSSRRSRPAPPVAALSVGEEAGEPFGLVAVEPGVDGVGVAGAEQAVARDGMRGEAGGDFDQGGTPLADVGAWVVVAVVDEFIAPGGREREGTTL